MPIESANDLFIANGPDLRHWHNVSSDIILYLRDKLARAGEAAVFKGTLPNLAAFGGVEDTACRGDVWANEETGVNLMWSGTEWVPVSLFRIDYDKEAIEGSERGIQSGYIWTALQNVITDEEIEEILRGIDGDQELLNSITSLSNQLADMAQDIQEMQARCNALPDPLISADEGNDITKGEDGGVYFDVDASNLARRVDLLETASSTTIESIIQTDGSQITVNEDSPNVIFIEASEDVNIAFEAMPRTRWMVKHLYIEALQTVRISFANSIFANQSEDPQYGNAGFSILIRCTWIGGKIILEVLDNSQCASNLQELGW